MFFVVVIFSDVAASSSFLIPVHAYISNFTAITDGHVIVGIVKTKEEAEKDYQNAKDSNQTTGIVSQSPTYYDIPAGFEKFSTSISLKANSTIEFIIEYEEILIRYLGRYQISLSTPSVEFIHKLKYTIQVEEKDQFDWFGFYDDISAAQDDMTAITLTTNLPAKKVFIHEEEWVTGSDLSAVRYDVLHAKNAGTLFLDTSKNYFIHYFSPSGFGALYKHIVFVIDCSGSMSGQKIVQAREATMAVIRVLLSGDQFNVMCFDGAMIYFRDNLVQATENNKNSAINWVESNIDSRGSTDINLGLLTGLAALNNVEPSSGEVSMVVFMTDGAASSGVTDSQQIRQNVLEANVNRYAIHSLGFGSGANMGLLNGISYENNGVAWKVYETDLGGQDLEDFFGTVSSPILKNVNFEYYLNKQSTSISDNLISNTYNQLYDGMELMKCGVIDSVGGFVNELKFNVDAIGSEGDVNMELEITDTTVKYSDWVERAWANLWLSDLMHQIQIADLHEDMDEDALIQEATDLALEYQLVSPYTSIVLVVPKELQASEPSSNDIYEYADGRTAHSGWMPSNSESSAVSMSIATFLLLSILLL